MTRVVAAAALLFALAAPVRAETSYTRGDAPLSSGERLKLHSERAAAAAAAGDQRLHAIELAIACVYAMYTWFDPAIAPCPEADAAARALTDRYAEATLHAQRSCVYAWLLRWDEARAQGKAALALQAHLPAPDQLDGEPARLPHLCIGAVAIEQGQYGEALAELELYLRHAAASGDTGGRIVGHTWMCRLRRVMGEAAEARAQCLAAEALAERSGDRYLSWGIYWNLGDAEWIAGRMLEAEAAYRKAIAIAVANQTAMFVTTGRADLTALLIEAGRLDAAAEVLAQMDADLAAGRMPPSYGHQLRWLHGNLATGRGDDRAAIDHYGAAIASSPLYGVVLESLGGRAAARHRLGDLAGARADYEQAIHRIEAARERTPGEDQRASYMERHARIYRELVGVLWDQLGSGAAERALEVAEAGRARALLDALRAAGVEAAAVPARPLTAAAIRAQLPASAQLLLYVATERRLLGIAVGRDVVRMAALSGAGDAAALAGRVDFYRQQIAEVDDPAELDAPGTRLYRDLVAPLAGDAPTGTLIISADGPLHLLPFDALRLPGGGFLIERAQLVSTPSGSVLGAGTTGAPAPDALLALALPQPPDLPPLTASSAEADAVSRELTGTRVLLTGDQASEPDFHASAPARFALLHFATHAVADPALPLRSGLRLADRGSDDDGWLRADEIYRLQLAADAVVLSACRTAGGVVGSGEGPLSLARAFLHAGARSVIATLVDVPDAAGPPFMAALYRRLAAGEPLAAALAGAQRDRIAAGAPPRAWAGYVAIGRPDTRATVTPAAAPAGRGRRLWVLPLAAAGFAALALGLLLRRRA